MYFIADGEIEIRLRRTTYTLGPGDYFGEVSLLKKVQRIGTITASQRSHLMVIDAVDFEALLQRNDELRERITEVADARLAEWADLRGDVSDEEMEQAEKAPRPAGDRVA
jgi:voltage-gated potassium channel